MSSGILQRTNFYNYPCISAVCPSGQYLTSAGDCALCPQGFYKDNTKGVDYRFGQCEQCPVNFTTNGTGAISEDECNIGEIYCKTINISQRYTVKPVLNHHQRERAKMVTYNCTAL